MAKETRKQIIEQTRNAVARSYKVEIENLKERLKQANECSYQFRKAYNEEKQRADELQEKLKSYEEWVERMQDFVNMPQEERENAYKAYLDSQKLNETLSYLSKMTSTLFFM